MPVCPRWVVVGVQYKMLRFVVRWAFGYEIPLNFPPAIVRVWTQRPFMSAKLLCCNATSNGPSAFLSMVPGQLGGMFILVFCCVPAVRIINVRDMTAVL